MDDLITIFTPAYNRAKLLPRLYESILQQNFPKMEWLVVDDGSTDGTDELCHKFIAENRLPIRYFKKENGGKHTAINLGVKMARGSIFYIADSDDILAENCLQNIWHYFQKIKDNDKICGITGLFKYYQTDEIVGDSFPKDEWEVAFTDIYFKYHLKGDKTVAFKTDVIKKYPFPERMDIRFVFEAVVWHEMAKKYNFLTINKVLEYKEYQNEGLSNSSRKLWYVRALAFSYYNLIRNKTYSRKKYPRQYFWNYIHLATNELLSKDRYFNLLPLKDKLVYLALFPRAYYIYLKQKSNVKND